MKKFYLFILFINFSLSSYTQNEFLSRVNPSDLSFTTFDSIPGVKWIVANSATLDENNHRFFFIGSPPSNAPHYLFTLNSLTGGTIYNPLLPSNASITSQFIGLEFDNNSDTLYGLFRENSTQKWCFSWIDPTNGFVHYKDSTSSPYFAIGSSTYDKNHHRYFYFDGTNENVIDAHTGQVIYSYVPSHPILNQMYDNVTDRLYCLSNPVSTNNWEFDSMEVSTGILHHISTLPCQNIAIYPVFKAIDELNGRYFFIGFESSNYYFYTIDILTGNVLSSTIFTLFGSVNNLIEFNYDNVLDTLFALHWGSGATTITETNNDSYLVNIYPNPSSGFITLSQNIAAKSEIEIYNILGESIYKSTISNLQTTINLSSKPKGIYFVKVYLKENTYCKKIIIN